MRDAGSFWSGTGQLTKLVCVLCACVCVHVRTCMMYSVCVMEQSQSGVLCKWCVPCVLWNSHSQVCCVSGVFRVCYGTVTVRCVV